MLLLAATILVVAITVYFTMAVRPEDLPVVEAGLLRERPSAPTLGARGKDGDHIDAASLDRSVSADLLKALATKQLARTRHMVGAAEAEVIGLSSFGEWGACQSQFRIRRKLREEE